MGKIRGRVKSVTDRGFGFIATDEVGKDVFYHENSLEGELATRKLREGDRVSFDIRRTEKGLNAVNLELMSSDVGESSVPAVDRKHIKHSLLNEQGYIKKELIAPTGKDNVKDLVRELKNKRMSTTQLRNFYHEVVNIWNNYKSSEFENHDDARMTAIKDLYLLLALIQYKCSSEKTPRIFKEIVDNRINIIVKSEDRGAFTKNLEAFYLNMQALVAYLK